MGNVSKNLCPHLHFAGGKLFSVSELLYLEASKRTDTKARITKGLGLACNFYFRNNMKFDFLRHNYPSPFTFDGKIWPTVHHAMIAYKSLSPYDREWIREEKSESQLLTYSALIEDRPDWGTIRAVFLQNFVLLKFKENEDLFAKLLEVKDFFGYDSEYIEILKNVKDTINYEKTSGKVFSSDDGFLEEKFLQALEDHR